MPVALNSGGHFRSEEGFQVFSQDTYLAYSGEYESYSDYTGKELKSFINQDETYLDHLLSCVQESLTIFLSKLEK